MNTDDVSRTSTGHDAVAVSLGSPQNAYAMHFGATRTMSVRDDLRRDGGLAVAAGVMGPTFLASA
jgi:hypothetical protein